MVTAVVIRLQSTCFISHRFCRGGMSAGRLMRLQGDELPGPSGLILESRLPIRKSHGSSMVWRLNAI
ncbi:hypothetical protein PspLS_11926 [Pyricularia sp. CBS 133598]|nr:hypothetical protein PspLS_11926 [Pyricularia sp. CBS 133598]